MNNKYRVMATNNRRNRDGKTYSHVVISPEGREVALCQSEKDANAIAEAMNREKLNDFS